MMKSRRAIFAILALAGLAACSQEATPLGIQQERPDAGCLREKGPESYAVYFAIDVSGSMGPFLNDLKSELVSFADGFVDPEDVGAPVRVDYYVVAFVNDIKSYGGKMTTVGALQSAFDEAIARGQTNFNLTTNRINAEAEENTLDAIAKVLETRSDTEARMLMIAGDAPFVEAPRVLSDNITVQSTYESVYNELRAQEFRVHAFVPDALDGLSRSYGGKPALTSLPGSSVHSLHELTGAGAQIRDTLRVIARGASCN